MIISKELYELISKKTELPIDLISSIGSSMFQELRDSLENPKEISYEMPKLGIFNLRFNKFEYYGKKYKEYASSNKDERYLKNKETKLKQIQDLEEKIQNYRKIKSDAKTKRKAYISGENNI